MNLTQWIIATKHTGEKEESTTHHGTQKKDFMEKPKRLSIHQMSREIKKCVLEILDALYDRSGFDDWWDRLDEELSDEITEELEEIVKRRLRDR